MGVSHFLTSLHFLHPVWFLALPPLLLLTVWLARANSNDGSWSRIVDSQLLPLLRVSEDRRARSVWPLLLATIWTLAVLALAGPAWPRRWRSWSGRRRTAAPAAARR